MAPDDPALTCTALYTVTQTDVDAGVIDNTASATGTPSESAPPLMPVESSAVVPIERIADLALVKSSDAMSDLVAGNLITFTFSVSNTGNVTLTDVTVTDPLAGLSGIDCGGGTAMIATLAPADAPVECTTTYTIIQDDVDNGVLTTTATVNGTPPAGVEPPPTASDTLNSPFDPAPALAWTSRRMPWSRCRSAM